MVNMTIPPTQKALVVSEVGKPLQLVNDRSVSQPGPGQVLLKVGLSRIYTTGIFVDT